MRLFEPHDKHTGTSIILFRSNHVYFFSFYDLQVHFVCARVRTHGAPPGKLSRAVAWGHLPAAAVAVLFLQTQQTPRKGVYFDIFLHFLVTVYL